jgi:hypothetical protein
MSKTKKSEKANFIDLETTAGFVFAGISASMFGVAKKNLGFKISATDTVIEAKGEDNSVLYRSKLLSQKFNNYIVPKDDNVRYSEYSVSDFRKAVKDIKKKTYTNLYTKDEDSTVLYINRTIPGKDTLAKCKVPMIEGAEPQEHVYPKYDESQPNAVVPASEFNTDCKLIDKAKSVNTLFVATATSVKISTSGIKKGMAQKFYFGKPGDEKVCVRKIPTKVLMNITKCCTLDKMMRIYVVPGTSTIVFSIDAANLGTHEIFLIGKKK